MFPCIQMRFVRPRQCHRSHGLSSTVLVCVVNVCLLLCVFGVDGGGYSDSAADIGEGRCRLYTDVPECFKRMGYNLTRWPNSLDESSSLAVNERLKNMEPLVRTHCHPWLFAFLCFSHVPLCEEHILDNIRQTRVVGPCKKLCTTVRDACQPYIGAYNDNLTWPQHLYDCDKYVTEGQCFMPSGETNETNVPTGYDIGPYIHVPAEYLNGVNATPTTRTNFKPPITTNIICDGGSAIDAEWYRFGGQAYCGQSCSNDTTYAVDQRDTVMPVMILIFSVLSTLALLLSLASYLADQKNFMPAEWSALVITACALVTSVVQLSAITAKMSGQNLSCTGPDGPVIQGLGGKDRLPPVGCLLYFVFSYFSNTLSLFTWLKLAAFWLVSVMATRQTVMKFESYCNIPATVIVWFLPAGLTVSAFFLKKIDGGLLTGSCYIGHYDTRALLSFVICPLAAIAVAVLFCIFVGWRVLLLHRKYAIMASPKSTTTNSTVGSGSMMSRSILRCNPSEMLYGDQFERLGKFCFLLLIPAVLTIGTLLYEYMEQESWQYTTVACAQDQDSPGCAKGSRPILAVFALRYASRLVIALICLWYKNLLRRWIPCLKQACATSETPLQTQVLVPIPTANNANNANVANGVHIDSSVHSSDYTTTVADSDITNSHATDSSNRVSNNTAFGNDSTNAVQSRTNAYKYGDFYADSIMGKSDNSSWTTPSDNVYAGQEVNSAEAGSTGV